MLRDYIHDCLVKLSEGSTSIALHQNQIRWQPMWFMHINVANGEKTLCFIQLSAKFIDAKRESKMQRSQPSDKKKEQTNTQIDTSRRAEAEITADAGICITMKPISVRQSIQTQMLTRRHSYTQLIVVYNQFISYVFA